MSVLFTTGVLILLLLWAVAVFNRLVRLRNQVTNGWKQVDVQLKRRHDLVLNLVNTVTGATELERDTLEAVTSARNRALTNTGPTDASRKESALAAALGRFFAVAESYPELTANLNVRALQEEFSNTENRIGVARQFYDNLATKYNAATEVVPGNIIAGLAGFKRAELFEMASDAARAAAAVDGSTQN